MKITYDTKFGLLPKKERVNQWWDSDGNEVKDVVNANADELDNVKESGNEVSVVNFMKTSGNYVGTPCHPIVDVPIILDEVDAVSGGFSIIWYSGEVLSGSDFILNNDGDEIVIFSGVNILNEMCRITIDFDKKNRAFSVNIQTGFTGDLPCNNKPEQMTITEII